MNINEKKIDDICRTVVAEHKEPDEPTFDEAGDGAKNYARGNVKTILQSANITGKDGLLDVLGEMTYLVSSLAKHAPMLLPKEEEAIKRANDHLSQWRQK